MNDFKASTPNFDSSYIYKVEEREESEQIIRESDRGLLSIENNELPKVTRYFLKNNKGEPQGYIEKKFIQNFTGESQDDEFNPQNLTNEKLLLESAPEPHKENQKMKINSQITQKSEKKSCAYNSNPKRCYRSRERFHPKKFNEINGCVPLMDSSVFDQSKNYTLDFTSANSTPSDRTFNVKLTARTADTVTERKIESKPTKEKDFSKMFTKKPQKIFCKDPNQRLKNLFTIVKPNENLSIPKCYDFELLNKTKELLVKLIDKELERVQPDEATNYVRLNQDNVIDRNVLKQLKLECIEKIEDELRLMKRLEN